MDVFHKSGGADDAIRGIFGIARWQSIGLEGDVGCNGKNHESALNFGKECLRVGC